MLSALLFMIGTSGCDCHVQVKGRILSSSTREAIGGASIIMMDRDIKTSSNEKGQFLLSEQTGFCYTPNIEITKSGYKPFRISIQSDSESISYQVSSESESIDLEKPVYSDLGDSSTFAVSTWIGRSSRNFEVKDDSIIFYLDKDEPEREVKSVREGLKENKPLNR